MDHCTMLYACRTPNDEELEDARARVTRQDRRVLDDLGSDDADLSGQ